MHLPTAVNQPGSSVPSSPPSRRTRVWQELRALGMSRAALYTMESRHLPRLIHDDEHIGGVAYGWINGSFAMLVATNLRVIFLDKKPLFVSTDEISYNVVAGVEYGSVGFGATVTLHTRVRDFVLHTLNERSSRGFVRYLETRAVEHEPGESPWQATPR